MSRLVILSGPSCIGKSPLLKALKRFYPEIAADLHQLVLFNDRDPRPGEEDGRAYHFRPRHFIEAFRGNEQYLVTEVRRDLQALEIRQVHDILASGKCPFFEGNPYIATALMTHPGLADIPRISCFLSPLSAAEITEIKSHPYADAAAIVTYVMRRKLLRRTQKQKGILSLHDLEDIEARCGAAWHELALAHHFDWVLPNHDGEDSENWEAFYFPLGDARKCLNDFTAMLSGTSPLHAEKWE